MGGGRGQGEWNDPPGVTVDTDASPGENADADADADGTEGEHADVYLPEIPALYIYMYSVGAILVISGIVGLFAVGALALVGESNTPLLIASGSAFIIGFTFATIFDTKQKIEQQRQIIYGRDGRDGGDR